MNFATSEYSSPIGPLFLVARGRVLHVLSFPELWTVHRARLLRHFSGASIDDRGVAPAITAALDEYFGGDLEAVTRIATEASGTPFQRSVWERLRSIPPGETVSYGAIARDIGAPTASRAVGAANGANPISVVLPCHRVIGSSGGMTGYGGGLPRKRWLLEHERRFAAGAQPALFAAG